MFINNSQIDNIQGKNVYLKIYRRLLLCAIFLIYYSSIGYSQINAGTNKTICKGESVTLGSVNICDSCQYLWSPSTGLSSTNTARPVANPTITTTYSVTITSNSYIFTTQITVTVNRIPVANAGADQTICYGKSATLTAKGGNSYSWSNRQVTSIITVSPTVTTQYNVTAYIDNCIATDNVVVYVSSLPKSNFIDANSTNFLKCSSSGGNAIFDLSIKNESTPLSNIKQYKIDWGDSSPDTILNNLDIISHKYTQMGYFNLKCIVIDKYGCTGTFNQKIFNGSNPVIGLGIPGNTTGCLQSAFEFPINYKNISGYTNPPGTIYVISFYYGTDHTDTTYVQPSPPAEPMQSVKHSFNKCSCGAVSLNDKNSFYVKITATNECSPSSFSTAGPIQISQKPICDFDISPLSKGCANMDFTIISKITGGKYIRNNICDSNINKYWVITPANYTIATSINNKLGSSINFPADPNSHGSNSITVRFTKMGKYSIKLVAENACGTDTIFKFKEICIDSIPIAKFNVSDFGGCTPHTVNFTDMSVTNSNCNSVSYNWTISEALCNNSNAYSYMSGTNSSSYNPIIKFNKPGIYNIKLEVSANCGKSISFTSINVKSKPDLILKSSDTICEGLSISPSVTNVACNTPTVSYSWSFTGGSITGINNQNPGSITYSKTGNYQINVKGKNGCGDTNIRKILNVISKPEVDICDTI
ncbi:MAG: hypothetical protein Q8880_06010 [Bacteroidota bacterium]|nr:hypothetical protein [Bacteroidota bacterium]